MFFQKKEKEQLTREYVEDIVLSIIKKVSRQYIKREKVYCEECHWVFIDDRWGMSCSNPEFCKDKKNPCVRKITVNCYDFNADNYCIGYKDKQEEVNGKNKTK